MLSGISLLDAVLNEENGFVRSNAMELEVSKRRESKQGDMTE